MRTALAPNTSYELNCTAPLTSHNRRQCYSGTVLTLRRSFIKSRTHLSSSYDRAKPLIRPSDRHKNVIYITSYIFTATVALIQNDCILSYLCPDSMVISHMTKSAVTVEEHTIVSLPTRPPICIFCTVLV